ncbi:platelet endothelial cell adhesion molecule isoform X2 [Oreochromis niloticus]|uniref:Platelet endothelial cell adhesion molecule n=1 Tax=Oreochromis niloticus TaxID=8128 RepID=A0A669F3E8_ORENI|nr:platelet endothelial cell adhesion molecule isoform X2 [Oreochromis niloticus]
MGLPQRFILVLLSIYLYSASVVNTQQEFKIQSVKLIIEPRNDVTAGTNVTLRCQATVSTSTEKGPIREYTILKNDKIVYTKTIGSSEDFVYQLHNARVFSTGLYQCKLDIQGDTKLSKAQRLNVQGLSQPVLHLEMNVVNEGEEVQATCIAPGEIGSFIFFFFDNDEQMSRVEGLSNQAKTTFRLSSGGIHKIHCSYKIRTAEDTFPSTKSNNVTVSVKELSITPVLKISPDSTIYEGDHLNISCSAQNFHSSSEGYKLFLSQGTKLLRTGNSTINHNMVAVPKVSEALTFDCRVEMRNVEKYTKKAISVVELFSVPSLTMFPTEIFQGEIMTLTCNSERFASQRINREDLEYTLYPSKNLPSSGKPGVFNVKALQNDFNYTCSAEAKGIKKDSKTLMIRPKVHVSALKISIEDKVILKKSITILCQSNGSLPINYTLFKDNVQVGTKVIRERNRQAVFMDVINKPGEIQYRCEAKNSLHSNKTGSSQHLSVNVIVPLSLMTLTVIPTPLAISEGEDLRFICSVNGTGPVTFKWYRTGSAVPLQTNTTTETYSSFVIKPVSKNDSDKYYCEASNGANKVRSENVDVQVLMALWKKMLIIVACLLLLSVLLLVASMLYIKSKRDRREAAAELSVKPSSPKSDDPLTVNLTHDTDVYNAATVKVDRAEVSVWSKRKPETESDDEISKMSNEPNVEYTEVVHARSTDPDRVPLRKGTDTVYSELQNSPHGAADPPDYGSVEYAELNREQFEISQYHPQVHSYQDLPEPVD